MFSIFPTMTEQEPQRAWPDGERRWETEDGTVVRVRVDSFDGETTVRVGDRQVRVRPGGFTSVSNPTRPVRVPSEGSMHFDRFGEPCGRF